MKKALSIIIALAFIVVGAFTLASCGAKTYKVGVQSGTTGWSFMTGDADWGFAGFANIEVSSFENGGLAVEDMLNGNVDFVVIDDAPAKQLVSAKAGTKFIDIPLTTESYGIAINKADAALLESVNGVISSKKADIDAIFKKYENVNDNSAANWTGTTIPAGTYDASKSQFVVATNAAFAPYEFKVGENFAGIDMEIAKLIADTLGMELVIVDMDFDVIVSSIGKNGVDAGIAAMTINAKRKLSVNFADPYYSGAYQVVVCKDDCTLFDGCKTTEELVAVLDGLGK